MTPKELQEISITFLAISEQLNRAAKADAKLLPLANAVNKVWEKAYKISDKRLLAEGEQLDAGVVLWTVFSPIKVQGSSEHMGIREVVRTPTRLGRAVHWHDEDRSRKMDWQHQGEWPADLDFRRQMSRLD